jgi:hypothetical protein
VHKLRRVAQLAEQVCVAPVTQVHLPVLHVLPQARSAANVYDAANAEPAERLPVCRGLFGAQVEPFAASATTRSTGKTNRQ